MQSEGVKDLPGKLKAMLKHRATDSYEKLAKALGRSKPTVWAYANPGGAQATDRLPLDAFERWVTTILDILGEVVPAPPDRVAAIENLLRSRTTRDLDRLLTPAEGDRWRRGFIRERRALSLSLVTDEGLRLVEQRAPADLSIKVDHDFSLDIRGPHLRNVQLFCESAGGCQCLADLNNIEGGPLRLPAQGDPYFLNSVGNHRFLVIASHRELPSIDGIALWQTVLSADLDRYMETLERTRRAAWRFGEITLTGTR